MGKPLKRSQDRVHFVPGAIGDVLENMQQFPVKKEGTAQIAYFVIGDLCGEARDAAFLVGSGRDGSKMGSTGCE